MGRISKTFQKSRFFTLLVLSLLPLLFQNCGDVDVSRSLSLGSDIEAEEELAVVEEEVVEEEVVPEPEVPVVPVVPKVTRFEFTPAMAVLSDGSTLDGADVIIPRGANGLVDAGLAEFTFTVEVAGEYIVDASVLAPDTMSNSYFANMDVEPTVDMAWHMLPAADFAMKRLSRGGTADIQNPEHRFILNEGVHVLKLRGREANMRLGGLTIEMVP